jgi:type II secretory pathway pseudopilin PulG
MKIRKMSKRTVARSFPLQRKKVNTMHRKHHRTRPRLLRHGGFTLMEVMLSIGIFLMMTLLFTAAFPLVTSQAQAGNNNNQAAMLAEHKLDQLRSAGFTVLQSPNGNSSDPSQTLQSLGIIDGSPSANTVPYTADFTTVDNLAITSGTSSGYFPAGATGTLSVQDASSVAPPGGAPVASIPGGLYLVTVTIKWPSTLVVGGTYSASTLIAETGGK